MTGDRQLPQGSKKLTEPLDGNSALRAAKLGIWEVDPTNNLVLWDDRCRELFGLAKDNPLPYEQAIQYIHPEDVDRVNRAVQQATNPASDGLYDETYRTVGADDNKLRWVHFWGEGTFTASGELYRFAGVAQEVTRQVETEQEVQRQRRIYGAITDSTPDQIYVFDLNCRFTYVNQALLDMWGSTWEKSIGKGLLENGYDPWHAQLHEREIDQVVATRQSVRGEVSFSHATLGKRIYDYVFVPVLNEAGEVEAIAGTTRDITDLEQARRKLEESEAFLQSIIDLAELGIYSIDLTTNQLSKSPRVASWYGLPELTDVDTSMSVIEKSDLERITQALSDAIQNKHDGYYNLKYGVINAQTGQKRILRTTGQLIYNSDGKPIRIDGSVQDITSQQAVQLSLEQQVQQRTEELLTANQDLAASNEEYAAINGELEESNNLLIRSNDNLQQFAYVASHDLQEPLRKIQQFGDLLQAQYTDQLGEGITFLERMQSAASRMSTLIRDLLTFSRISTQRDTSAPVALGDVVNNVLSTLELTIEQTRAQLIIDPLPTLAGDVTQLNQLFQNLLSNALKFRRAEVTPRIRIRSSLVKPSALPAFMKNARQAGQYYRIDVVDNGIGFDEKYLDRIFEVFQRLHGRNEFAGTGIGLAICEKVVTNHGGIITASSRPGEGATFSVYLPA